MNGLSTANTFGDANLQSLLHGFMETEGVTAVALVGRDGFVIENIIEDDLNVDALGAMVATSVESAERLGKEFGLGEMEQYLSEFAMGKVIMAPVKNDILAIFTDKQAVIGSIRYSVSRDITKLASFLY